LAAAILLAGAATPVTAQISWVQRPSEAEVDAAYPAAAKEKGLVGHAWIDCNLAREGILKDCRPSTESPPGQGFGAAAVKLSAAMQTSSRVAGPDTVRVTVPVHFGPPTPDRPIRSPAFATSDGRVSITDARFRKLAPIGPYWPDNALRMGLAGRTAIDCQVGDKGALNNCAIVGEATSHPMFGEAALAMARRGWMKAGPPPADVAAPADGVWRFVVDYPAHTLDDVR